MIALLVVAMCLVGTCGVGLAVGLLSSSDFEDERDLDGVPLQTWSDLSELKPGDRPTPTAYPDDGRPRLVIFGASWCPGCNSGAPAYAALAQRFRRELEIGVALREKDADFTSSKMARWLSDVPIWTESSTARLTDRCDVQALPAACLLIDGEAAWSGGAGDGVAVVTAHLEHDLDRTLDRREAFALRGASAAERRVLAAEPLHGFASSENGLAWSIASDDSASDDDLVLAAVLARDASIATHGLDYAILDTYALALAKLRRDDEAAVVARRILGLCDALGQSCPEERRRADMFIMVGG